MDRTDTSQKERLAAALQRIKLDVTADDRKKCLKKLKLSEATLKNYLGGAVSDNGTGTRILEFLNGRIKERDTVISSI